METETVDISLLNLKIKENAVHSFRLWDIDILEAWAKPNWAYRTYCDEVVKPKKDARELLKKNSSKIFAVDGISLVKNPKRATCPICKAKMSDDIDKISEETLDIVLAEEMNDLKFFDVLNLEEMKKHINSRLFCMFNASGGGSLDFLEDFKAKEHLAQAETMVRVLKEEREEILPKAMEVYLKLTNMLDRYISYYENLRNEVY